jgi:hypothetical protein
MIQVPLCTDPVAAGGMGHTHEPPTEDYDHILCCNVNEAVCGRNVMNVGFCVAGCTEHKTCQDCADILSDDTWICPDCRRGWWVE